MMTVLYGIGTVLRFILRVVLLPVQAVLTLVMLAMAFIGSLACTLFQEVGKSNFKKSENRTLRSRKTRLQEVGKTDLKKSEKPTLIITILAIPI